MRYILSLLPVFPYILLATAVVYAGIYIILKSKRKKPGCPTIIAEFALVGWLAAFIYVTQIMAFGNGMGDMLNLVPFKQFVVAFRYGSNNAGGVWQFLLNIIMFMPLGFLLPIVFKRFRNWHSVFIISLAFTVATELMQLITSRGTDIDDVIANTVGGLCGFALYLIIIGLINIIWHKDISVLKYRSSLYIGIAILVVITGIFCALKFCDGSSKYGNLYYGHLIPTEVDVTVELDNEQTERAVFRYSENITIGELEEKLQSLTGFVGDWTESSDSDGTTYSLFDGENKAIFIFPYNKWSIYYEYGLSDESSSAEIDESQALQKAWDYLKEFDITDADVTYNPASNAYYGDDHYYFNFASIKVDDKTRVYGNIMLELGKDGRLISINDNRVWCEYAESAQCISMADSIEIAQEVGCGDWDGKATVESVTADYSFIPETGYLIPVWKINGYLDDGSQTLEWHPEIDAVK